MAARKRIGLRQVEMAERLNLDSTYLSQLENGRREVDEFYVRWAEELATEHERVNRLETLPDAVHEATGDATPTPGNCLEYFTRFLETCTDAAKLGWTLVELREHFPLDKWGQINSVPDAVAEQAAKRAVAEAQRPGVIYGRSRKAASTSGKISSRAARAGEASSSQRASPKPAPE